MGTIVKKRPLVCSGIAEGTTRQLGNAPVGQRGRLRNPAHDGEQEVVALNRGPVHHALGVGALLRQVVVVGVLFKAALHAAKGHPGGIVLVLALGGKPRGGDVEGHAAGDRGGSGVGEGGLLGDEVGVGADGDAALNFEPGGLAGEDQCLLLRAGEVGVGRVAGPAGGVPGVHLGALGQQHQAQGGLVARGLAHNVDQRGIVGNGLMKFLQHKAFKHAALGIEPGVEKRGLDGDRAPLEFGGGGLRGGRSGSGSGVLFKLGFGLGRNGRGLGLLGREEVAPAEKDDEGKGKGRDEAFGVHGSARVGV